MNWTLALSLLMTTLLTQPGYAPYVQNGYISQDVNGGHWALYQMPWGVAINWSQPWTPCLINGVPVGPCDPQTYRYTIIESGINGPPMTEFAGRWARIQFHLYSSSPPENPLKVAPMVWQAFHAQSHRIFSCPPSAVDYTKWVTATCDIYLPTVEGLVTGPGFGLGVGLDLVTPSYTGWLDVAGSLELWLSDPRPP